MVYMIYYDMYMFDSKACVNTPAILNLHSKILKDEKCFFEEIESHFSNKTLQSGNMKLFSLEATADHTLFQVHRVEVRHIEPSPS